MYAGGNDACVVCESGACMVCGVETSGGSLKSSVDDQAPRCPVSLHWPPSGLCSNGAAGGADCCCCAADWCSGSFSCGGGG